MVNRAKRIALLGSTGSIGRQTLEIIDACPEQLKLVAMAAGENTELLAKQARRYRPDWISVKFGKDAAKLKAELGYQATILSGDRGLRELASLEEVDCVVVAVTGITGVGPTLAALTEGKRVALANKETTACAGPIVKEAIRFPNQLLPVDSEHSAIFQCLDAAGAVEKIILTASGGPFRNFSVEDMLKVSPQMALQHPNWAMGTKITVDSATMMNKGLEIIEAHWLFDLDYNLIDVVIHPESIIHSMVAYKDGSILGQLGLPDMRIPIQYALSWPSRWPSQIPRLDLAQVGRLTFEAVDKIRFPAVELAYAAGRAGGIKPAVLNAANEVAVAAFLAGKIGFLSITSLVDKVLGESESILNPSLEDIMASDSWARTRTQELIGSSLEG